MRAAVEADTARNRAALAGGPTPPARPARRVLRAVAAVSMAVLLSACSVTLYSRAWMSQAACDRLSETEARALDDCRRYEYAESYETHNPHGGYADACGDLPPLVGDDC